MKKDKQTEHLRYDARARIILESLQETISDGAVLGSSTIPPVLRAPYIKYEKLINDMVTADQVVVELGAGTGLHTYSLVRTGARIIASDISERSLEVIANRIGAPNLTTKVADIENLPFDSNSFDVITCAGSLSYGDPKLVNSEILRVLRPGGMFICVDSLNHNPIYKINRWIHYLRGERTKSTLIRMPTISRIISISQHFKSCEVYYYGSLSWLMQILSKFIGQERAANLSDYIDLKFRIKRSAFKFVMVAKGRF